MREMKSRHVLRCPSYRFSEKRLTDLSRQQLLRQRSVAISVVELATLVYDNSQALVVIGDNTATAVFQNSVLSVLRNKGNRAGNRTSNTLKATARNAAAREADREREQRQRDEARITRVDKLLNECTGWYVVLVPPQKEILIERLLGICNFPAFVPIQFRWRRVNSHQKVRRFVPYVMASRYVFIGTDDGEFPWARLLQLGLINSPLMFEGRPVWIPRDTMRGLFETTRETEDRQTAVRVNKSVVVGDEVLITEGPFRDHVVKVKGIERGRARAIVELFQTAHEIELDMGTLEPV
jgi:transcription antitermination factor NusG